MVISMSGEKDIMDFKDIGANKEITVIAEVTNVMIIYSMTEIPTVITVESNHGHRIQGFLKWTIMYFSIGKKWDCQIFAIGKVCNLTFFVGGPPPPQQKRFCH